MLEVTYKSAGFAFRCPTKLLLPVRTIRRAIVFQEEGNSNWRTFLMRTLSRRARRIRWSGLLLLVSAIVAGPARGQNQELTFSLGGIPGQTRSFQSSAGIAQISADRSFGINYGHRFLGARIAALYGEIEFVAIPNRSVTSATATVPQSYASLYLTPGLRLKFFLPLGILISSVAFVAVLRPQRRILRPQSRRDT